MIVDVIVIYFVTLELNECNLLQINADQSPLGIIINRRANVDCY